MYASETDGIKQNLLGSNTAAAIPMDPTNSEDDISKPEHEQPEGNASTSTSDKDSKRIIVKQWVVLHYHVGKLLQASLNTVGSLLVNNWRNKELILYSFVSLYSFTKYVSSVLLFLCFKGDPWHPPGFTKFTILRALLFIFTCYLYQFINHYSRLSYLNNITYCDSWITLHWSNACSKCCEY